MSTNIVKELEEIECELSCLEAKVIIEKWKIF